MPGDDDPERKAAYEAWAARLRTKKHDEQQTASSETTPDPPDTSGYWSTESLFRDSELAREHADEAQRRQAHVDQLLTKLDLPPGSSLKDCSERVKQLAREVHPDMNLDKSTRTGRVQLDKMVEINAAYDELKRLLA
ncbi:MAG: J domain-containing protein [Actinobacteria bacterium]|nr:J domain-containing protein [Actinomycetota bacterium]